MTSPLQKNYDALSQAGYITDLRIDNTAKGKIAVLRWYAYLPLIGRAISYIRFQLCNPSQTKRQLEEISREQTENFKNQVVEYIDHEDQYSMKLKQLYEHHQLLTRYFTQLSHLLGTNGKPDLNWSLFVQEASFTKANAALDNLNTNDCSINKIRKYNLLLKQVHEAAEALNATGSILEKRDTLLGAQEEINMTFSELESKAQKMEKKLEAMDPFESFMYLEKHANVGLSEALKLLVSNGPFQTFFPKWHQKFIDMDKRFQPNIGSIPREYLDKHLNELNLEDLCELGKNHPALRDLITPLIHKKTAELYERFKDRVHLYLNGSKTEKVLNLISDYEIIESTIKACNRILLKAIQIPNITKDINSNEIAEQAEKELKNFGLGSFDISKLKKAHRVSKLLGVSDERLVTISSVYKQIKPNVHQQVVELLAKVKQQLQLMQQLDEKQRYLKLTSDPDIEELHKSILTFKHDFKKAFPELSQELKNLKKQFKIDFMELSEKTQQEILSDLSNEDLFDFVDSDKRRAPAVERALALRSPAIFIEMVGDLISQVNTYAQTNKIDVKALVAKLQQMQMDAISQAKPQNLKEAYQYLSTQQDTLARLFSLAPPALVQSLKVHCDDEYISGTKFDASSDCYKHCAMHHGLKQALFWSLYYSIQKSYSRGALEQVISYFDRKIQAVDPILLAQLVFWNPRNTKKDVSLFDKLIDQIYKLTTSTEATPFDQFPSGAIKTEFLKLVSQIKRDTFYVLCAPELVPYLNQWTSLAIKICSLSKNKRVALLEQPQVYAAAELVCTSEYFKIKHPELYQAANLYISNFVESLPVDLLNTLFAESSNQSEEKNYTLLPFRLVCRSWSQLIEIHISKQMPENAKEVIISLYAQKNRDQMQSGDTLTMEQIYEEAKPVTDEIGKLTQPQKLEDAKKLWDSPAIQTAVKTVLLMHENPGKLVLPCLSGVVMGNLVGSKKKELNCCAIHQLIQEHKITEICDTYIKNPLGNSYRLDKIINMLKTLFEKDENRFAKLVLSMKLHGRVDERRLYSQLKKLTNRGLLMTSWLKQIDEPTRSDFIYVLVDIFTQYGNIDEMEDHLMLIDQIASPYQRQAARKLALSNWKTRSNAFAGYEKELQQQIADHKSDEYVSEDSDPSE